MDAAPDAGTLDADRGTRASSEPLWTSAADAVQVVLVEGGSVASRSARLELVDPGSSPADASLGRREVYGGAGATATALGPPPIIPRSAWGADEGLRLRQCPEGPAYAPTTKVGFVHHTATSNAYAPEESAAIIRGIYAFHVNGRGWCDIAYNFLVDQYGQIFEGRYGGMAWPVIGGHTGGFNTESFGVAMIGSFEAVAPPPATTAAVAHVLAWKLGRSYQDPHASAQLLSRCVENCRYPAGSVITFGAVSGHRDATLTDCPGDAGYVQVANMRSTAAAMLGPLSRPAVSFWESLGGSIVGAPAAAWWGPDRFDVFVTGVDAQLWHQFWIAGIGWSGWYPLGGRLQSGPSVTTWGPGRLDVVARGTDGQVWHRFYDLGRWSVWETLGQSAEAPAAVWSGAGRYDLFGARPDGQLALRTWRATGGWTDWQPLGGQLTSGPAVSSWTPGRVDVSVRGTDGALWHKFTEGDAWSGWESLGGVLADGPAAASWGWGRYDVFVAGVDGQLWHRRYDWPVGWSPWHSFGGVLTSGPGAAAVWGPRRFDVVVRGTDTAVWHRLHQPA
jgi:hypothetical protein